MVKPLEVAFGSGHDTVDGVNYLTEILKIFTAQQPRHLANFTLSWRTRRLYPAP